MTTEQYAIARAICPALPETTEQPSMFALSYCGAAIHKAILSDRVKLENGRIYFRITEQHQRFEFWKDKADRINKEMQALGYGRYIDALDSEANSIFFFP